MTLTLTRYDSNYYLASFNGRNDQLIGRAAVRTLLEAISALVEWAPARSCKLTCGVVHCGAP